MARFSKSPFLKKIFKRYIVVVYNQSNLKERVTVSLSPLNLLLILSSLVVIAFLFSALLISFTPVREVLPGFNDDEGISPSSYYRMQTRIDSLEHAIDVQHEVEESLRKILQGNDSSTSYYRRLLNRGRSAVNTASQPTAIFRFAVLENEDLKPVEKNSTKGRLPFFAPVDGYISERYDPVREHYAVDLVTPANAAVKAIADGYVVFAEWSATTGNVIILQHRNGLLSVYKHNSVLLQKTGSFVRTGDAIAIVGNSGEYTTGPHLHFEMWLEGNPLDPESFISFN